MVKMLKWLVTGKEPVSDGSPDKVHRKSTDDPLAVIGYNTPAGANYGMFNVNRLDRLSMSYVF